MVSPNRQLDVTIGCLRFQTSQKILSWVSLSGERFLALCRVRTSERSIPISHENKPPVKQSKLVRVLTCVSSCLLSRIPRHNTCKLEQRTKNKKMLDRWRSSKCTLLQFNNHYVRYWRFFFLPSVCVTQCHIMVLEV